MGRADRRYVVGFSGRGWAGSKCQDSVELRCHIRACVIRQRVLSGFRASSPFELIASSLAQTWTLFVRHVAHRDSVPRSHSNPHSSISDDIDRMNGSRASGPHSQNHRTASASNDAVVLGLIRKPAAEVADWRTLSGVPFRNVIRPDEHIRPYIKRSACEIDADVVDMTVNYRTRQRKRSSTATRR
jgi:hypothetical protein